MKKLLKTLAVAIMTLALTATSVTAFAETTTEPKTYDKYEIACIRSFKEDEYNKVLPDEYFGEFYGHYFDNDFEVEWELGITLTEGYEFNLDDFSDLGVTSVIEPDQWTEPVGLYRLFVENYSKSMQVAEILKQDTYSDKVEEVYAGMARIMLIESPRTLTLEKMQEYAPYFEENYTITWGDADGDEEVTVNDVVYYLRFIGRKGSFKNALCHYQADIHQDQKIDVLDLVTCVYKILEN